MKNINIFETDMFPYLEGEELKDKPPLTLTIRDLRTEEFQGQRGKKEAKEVLYFRETSKGLILNKTNAKRIAQMYGRMTGAWEGKQITLITEEVQAFGALHDAIRVAPGVIGEAAEVMSLDNIWAKLNKVQRISGFFKTPDDILECRPKSTPLPPPDDLDGWRVLYTAARDYALDQLAQPQEEGDLFPDEDEPEVEDLKTLYPDIFEEEEPEQPDLFPNVDDL